MLKIIRMRKIFLLACLFLSVACWAEENEKLKACENRAFDLYPEPNYSPRYGNAGARDPGRMGQNFMDAMPTLADTERAKRKRQQYIKECLARE